jgi:hypothetical protein
MANFGLYSSCRLKAYQLLTLSAVRNQWQSSAWSTSCNVQWPPTVKMEVQVGAVFAWPEKPCRPSLIQHCLAALRDKWSVCVCVCVCGCTGCHGIWCEDESSCRWKTVAHSSHEVYALSSRNIAKLPVPAIGHRLSWYWSGFRRSQQYTHIHCWVITSPHWKMQQWCRGGGGRGVNEGGALCGDVSS